MELDRIGWNPDGQGARRAPLHSQLSYNVLVPDFAVWKRDNGLCARHNLNKSDHIE